ADLVFENVDHSDISYEVRVFLNNRSADEATPRSQEEGYAGRFVVFGHGGCYGSQGHCDVPAQPRQQADLRPPHPLTGHTKIVTITKPLQTILASNVKGLESIT